MCLGHKDCFASTADTVNPLPDVDPAPESGRAGCQAPTSAIGQLSPS